jgi:membrane associated rhomboid family serine protease
MSDFPRKRAARPSWMVPIEARLTPTIKKLIVALATFFALYIFVPGAKPLLAHLVIGPGFFHGELWQPLTSLFVEFQVLRFGFDVLGLWFTGAMVERTQGTRRFVTLFFTAGVLGNLAVVGVGRLVGGIEGGVGCWLAVHALFVAFARIFDREQITVLPGLSFRGRNIGIFWVLFAIGSCLIDLNWPFLAGVLVTTATGYLLAVPGGWRLAYDGFRARRQRQRYKVLDGGLPGRANIKSQSKSQTKPRQKYWN